MELHKFLTKLHQQYNKNISNTLFALISAEPQKMPPSYNCHTIDINIRISTMPSNKRHTSKCCTY